ncbi:MAG: DUF1566 domain-containing protein [Prevotellaceae bacterium]|jgi:hypothetical protein|nr:DUF1566 domain-containing protein [Prevotellaceae bacterium]
MRKLHYIIALFFIATSVSATNYYVKPTGSDAYNGSKWTLAKKNPQTAINQAAAGDTIFVSVGTYEGGFVMREGITVMGGYVVSGNTAVRLAPNADDLENSSVLDGGGTQRTLTQIANFGTRTVWDGFVIKDGTSAGTNIAVGSLVYAENNTDIVGVVYQYDEILETGKMISIAESKLKWDGYQIDFEEMPYYGNAANDMNGAENTQAIIDKLGAGNAAEYCKNFLAGGFGDWHLPSVGEWKEIYAQKSTINSIMIAANTPLANGYWTSNHAGALPAWAYYFEDGRTVPTLKYIQKSVRAIRPFLKSELNISSDTGSSVSLKQNGILNHCIVDGVEVIDVAVENIKEENALAAVAGYYNIIGQKLPKKPESGIYIILYDNGKTEKVIK